MKKNCNSSYVCERYIGLFYPYPLTTNVPHHIETSQWFARLGAIWPGTLVAIGLMNFFFYVNILLLTKKINSSKG